MLIFLWKFCRTENMNYFYRNQKYLFPTVLFLLTIHSKINFIILFIPLGLKPANHILRFSCLLSSSIFPNVQLMGFWKHRRKGEASYFLCLAVFSFIMALPALSNVFVINTLRKTPFCLKYLEISRVVSTFFFIGY